MNKSWVAFTFYAAFSIVAYFGAIYHRWELVVLFSLGSIRYAIREHYFEGKE